jgi:hypothetical protein
LFFPKGQEAKMAIVKTGRLNIPNITCLTTDIVGGAVAGGEPGLVVYVSDAAAASQWFIVRADLQLVPYALPVEITVDGSTIEIGNVGIDAPVSESITLTPHFGIKTVATPGTGVPITAGSTKVMSITLWPKEGNVGTVYVGDSTVDKDTSHQIILTTTSPGIIIDVALGYNFDLTNLYVDAINANDGVEFIYYN